MTRYTLEEAKYILGLLAGRESGFTTATQTRDAARTVLDHLAEEPEWEYGTEYEIDANESVFTATHSEEMARKWVAESPHDTGLVRRRKAGPWEPVKN